MKRILSLLLFISLLFSFGVCQAQYITKEVAKKRAESFILNNKCKYDCKLVSSWIPNEYDYGKCFSVFVKIKAENVYGAHENITYAVTYGKNGPCNSFQKTTNTSLPNDKELALLLLKNHYGIGPLSALMVTCSCD